VLHQEFITTFATIFVLASNTLHISRLLYSQRRNANFTTLRAKPAISYAEPSSDTDTLLGDDLDSGDEIAESSTTRRASSRRAAKSRVQPQRSSQRIRAYQSDEEEDDEDEEDDLIEYTAPEPSRPSRRSTRNPVVTRTPNTNSRTDRPKRSRPRTYHSDESEDEVPKPKKRKMTRPPTPRSPQQPAKSSRAEKIFYSGIVPLWQTLPYHILLQIFKYAAYPLYDVRSFQSSSSPSWLLRMARLCRNFTEPALTALYCSPPLVPMVQAHRLVDVLRADPTTMAFGYRQKIESLHIDVGQVVAYSLAGSGHLDLRDLVKDLPRLVDLELYHQLDMSPYRDLDAHIKWTYPESLFDALEYVDPSADPNRGDKTSICKLKSWRWSSRLAGKRWSIENIQQIHLRPSFLDLRKIAFVNYQVPVLGKGEEDPNHEKILAESLRPLKNLEHLIFESSTLLNHKLLPLLPRNLRHLELINCWEVVADDFAEFLVTHGSQLRRLTLNHNQSLSLAFLPVLGSACPHLQVLKMNLTYYNLHATYRDSQPFYNELLLADQVPHWPTTLQILDLTQMRKWETDAAEMFFQSLLDSAATLPDLRKLNLQCILNIGWRDRAAFREKWYESLARAFKRVSDAPREITTMRSRNELAPQPEPEAEIKEAATPPRKRLVIEIDAHRPSSSSSASVHSPARRSQRTAAQAKAGLYAESPETSDTEPDYQLPSDSFPRPPRSNGLARELAILKQTAGMDSPPDAPSSPIAIDSDSDSDEPIIMSVKRKDKGKGKAKEVVQGMCEIVEVRIDNLRPMENQATEADFLDEEPSGDEDWNEGDDIKGYEGYAW